MERFASLRHRTNGKEQLSTLILDRRETLTEVGRKELEWAPSQLNPLIQQFNERITGTAEITLHHSDLTMEGHNHLNGWDIPRNWESLTIDFEPTTVYGTLEEAQQVQSYAMTFFSLKERNVIYSQTGRLIFTFGTPLLIFDRLKKEEFRRWVSILRQLGYMVTFEEGCDA